jgi:SHS2 domain-containing protein
MYEVFEHTADLGLRIWADDLNGLFADAAQGLFSVMVANLDAVKAVTEAHIELKADDLEQLLHDWLSELLYTFSARRLILTEFSVQIDGLKLTAGARGEPIDPARHELDAEVKAITWHGLIVKRVAAGWLAEVIVDI